MASLLILGGTSFVGRHLVEAALDAGHDVSTFNRGKTNPGLFSGVEHLVGDRSTGDYESLRGRDWDAVVDVSAYYPRQVREAAAALDGRVGHCTLISTVSVYAASDDPIDESSPLLDTAPGVGTEEITADTYGPLKILCEQAARELFPGATVVRPGIVAGPHDPTGRFTYWVRRMTRPGPVVATRPDAAVQVVHARDLAEVTLRATEQRLPETFNATGPRSEGATSSELLTACAEAAGVPLPEVAWVDDAFIAERELPLPLVLPRATRRDGLFQASCRAAERVGLVNRPLVETARDTLSWIESSADENARLELVTADAEAELLAAWAAR